MKKLMLAMSGGVDSSVAVVLLREKYDLCGATMRLFGDSESESDSANSAISEARKIAETLKVPHYVCDLRESFKAGVMRSFAESYINGETPNPCVVCNKYIKFGEFLDWAVDTLDCELMATGHYARVEFDKGSGRYLLKKAQSRKDQSYVLYSLSQSQLRRVIFPLGSLDKLRVREIAEAHGLTNSNKPDSQDICFVPDGDYAGFITRHSGFTPESGEITDKDGRILGVHGGIIKYTVGQRKGLGLVSPEPLYVIGKNAGSNRVVVGGNAELFTNRLTARDVNWIAFEKLQQD
ncbi:MAG: tRNA 2-thiouridine(34) synthase MnmA, partial [Oscillospiraceae bacterium]|nr:tRNA 2-thiouridine(34) synthase MnmA [Oscillospiraceae bacterium]